MKPHESKLVIAMLAWILAQLTDDVTAKTIFTIAGILWAVMSIIEQIKNFKQVGTRRSD